MSTFISPPRSAAIEYPDSDGRPMAENTLQFEWIVTLKGGVEALFRNDPNVFVAGDLLWYPVEGKPTLRTAPDVMVVFGRPKGYRGSYQQWNEEGIAPQVVFEVLSPGNRAGEMERKFQMYERHGVQEYYIYDPERGDLVGWRRLGDGLEPIPDMTGFISPRLKIRFEPGEGPNNLKIIGSDGRPFATYLELVEQAEVERRRAEAERERAEAECERAAVEHQRAEIERERAHAERYRAEQLARKLQELGIEPSDVLNPPD
jgi:Uma2 family endonuclease